MKSAQLSRFEAALQVVADALSEPEDFRRLAIVFGNGSRQLNGQAEAADDQASAFRYRLPGQNGVASAAELIGLIRAGCQLYDSCRLELYQRGQNRYFEVDARGARAGSLQKDDQPAGGRRQGRPSTHQPVEFTGPGTAVHAGDQTFAGLSATREYRIKLNEAPELLRALGITDGQGRLRNDKIRKYNQIDRLIELAEPLLNELADGRDSLAVFDLACGKSYLSFALNFFLREKMQIPCQFTGIDLAAGVIESSSRLAAGLGYRNMRFVRGDLGDFRPEGPVDLCVSLHACDVATDYALAAAVSARSRAILVVPCCQRELLSAGYQLPPALAGMLEHGVLKARLADLLTDNLRLLLLRAAGYEASLTEYISPLDTPKNLLLRARYTGRHDSRAAGQYRELIRLLGCTTTFGRIMEETDYGRHPGHRQS